MKKFFSYLWAPVGAILVACTLTFLVASCSDDAWEDLPASVFSFVNKYYPASEIDSYSNHGGVQTVKIKNGPSLYFDENDAWVRLDGDGYPLPPMLVFDQVPQTLYAYLEELEAVGDVLDLVRDSQTYTVTLPDSTIVYDTETGITRYEKALPA